MTPDWIGWLATAIFLSSYGFKDQGRLRRVQAAAALVWVGYGAFLHATPLVVANLLVAAVAIYSSLGAARVARSSVATRDIKPAAEPDLSRTSSPYS